METSEQIVDSQPRQLFGAARRGRGLWMLALVLLAFGVRAQGLFAGFVFDDAFGIQARAAANWSRLSSFFTTDQSSLFGSNFYRPVLSIWYELWFLLCGTHAAAWHLVSILLHVACTLLVFRLALRMTEAPFPPQHANRGRAGDPGFTAWLAAALFAVHPAHVEAISWASAMGDPLLTCFMLLSVLAFVRWMNRSSSAAGAVWWIASLLAGAAAIFTKETAVVLPVVLLVTALGLHPSTPTSGVPGTPRPRGKSKMAVLAATLPFFGVSAIFLGIRQSVLHSFSHPLTVASDPQMAFTWPAALLFYLRHMFWPGVVVPFYPLQIVKSWNSPEFFLPFVVLVVPCAVLGFLLWRAAGPRRALVCAAWTFVPLAPALYLKALAPFELVHDRFLYAPLVGFCMAAALVVQWASEHIDARFQGDIQPGTRATGEMGNPRAHLPRPAMAIAAFALLPLLGIESMSQMVWWQSNKTLFTRAVTITPENPKALIALGTGYIGERRYEEAVPLLRRALEIEPGNSGALFAMGRIAWEQGDDEKAAIYLTQALRLQPRYDMWLHLASIELHRHRVDAAEAAARQALAMNGEGPGVHVAMGAVLLKKGDNAGAAREFREELRLHPQSEPALAGLAQATGSAQR
jgi:protein O-mannosyl-transferase